MDNNNKAPCLCIKLFMRLNNVCLACFSFFQSCILASLLSEDPTRVKKVVDMMQHQGEARHLFDTDVSYCFALWVWITPWSSNSNQQLTFDCIIFKIVL